MSSALPITTASGRPASELSPRSTAVQGQAVHRSDIEGLRGIAVLSVLAVHSFPQWLQGGFIGVDIFFVLSGYLISTLLWQSLEAGRFSVLDFYARRIRRLYPALCLVLLACLAFSVAFTFPSVSHEVGEHVAAGALFVSNIALWSEAGYFDAASESKPLLHLWSLGIEEQFYIVWPLAAVFLFKHKGWALRLLCGALLLSFALNAAFVADKPVATFFLPPTRFWELMVGALLAWLTLYGGGGPVACLRRHTAERSRPHRHAADGLAWLGLGMLAVALYSIDKTDPFPGWRALLPTLGTFALIAAGPEAWVNRRVLSQPILRFYGAISYPLYLWHWPLLSFPVILGVPLTAQTRVTILIASVVLAALTFELLEKPIRRAGGRRSTLTLLTALLLIGAGGWIVKQSDGLLDTYPTSVREIASAEFDSEFQDYRIDQCFLRTEQGPETFADRCIDRSNTDRSLVFLWGDSHAASLYAGLRDESTRDNPGAGFRLAQFTAAACPPLMPAPAHSVVQCNRTNQAVLERIAAERPATVILAGHWSKYGTDSESLRANLASLRQTVARLRSMGVGQVVVFGNFPTWTLAPPRILLNQWNQTGSVPARTTDHLDPASVAVDLAVKHAMIGSGAVFVSPIERLCDESGCLVSTQRQGVFRSIAFDLSHLTAEGSRALVERSRSALFEPVGRPPD